MSTVSYADVYKQFIDGGFGATSEVLPTGTYPLRIALVKGEQKQGKKFGVGVRVVVMEPHAEAGKSTWINQTLTLPEPGNDRSTTAFMMYLKFMKLLGVPDSALQQGTPPERLHEYIVIGTEGVGQLNGDRKWGNPPKASQDLVGFTVTGVPSALGGMIPVGDAPAAPVAPVAAPVPVPVTVAVAAPVPAPAGPTVEELQRQLAALQTPAVQVSAAPVPSGPSF